MTQAPHTTVIRLLKKLQKGDRSVFDDLFARVYEEMRAQAHHQRRRWHRDYTLNTTALVHETYLKPWLTSTSDPSLDCRREESFFKLLYIFVC